MANSYKVFPIHSVDLTTVAPTNENKSYLINQRLLDQLLSKFTKGDLDDIKEDLKIEIAHADSKDDLFTRLDNYIYLNKIVTVVNNLDKLPEIVGKIDLNKLRGDDDLNRSQHNLDY